MLNFIPIVVLLFNAADAVQPKPIYDGKHFMYHNEQGVPTAVTLTNKVFIEIRSDDEKKALNNAIEEFYPKSVEEFAIDELAGVLCEFYYRVDTLDFLNKFPFFTKNRNYYPVVIWEGTEAIALQEIRFKTRSFIPSKQIKNRLNKITNLKLEAFPTSERDVSLSWLYHTNTYLNVYMLANLVSSDSAWFEWCSPVFRPLNGYISAHAYVTSPANTNLGEERVLNIVVQVYGNAIKIREDLQPHSFRPWPTPKEHWFDAGPRTIKKSVGKYKTTYIISYPFRHLDLGGMMFPDLFVTYEEGPQRIENLRIDNVHYYISSIIEGTDIDDIQPIEKMGTTPLFELFELDDTQIKLLTYLTYFGAFFCLSGLVFCSFPVIAYLGERRRKKKAAQKIALRNSKAWKELIVVWAKMSDSSVAFDWRESYLDVYSKFKKVLAVQYSMDTSTISSKDFKGTIVNSILVELEKVFQKAPKLGTKEVSGRARLDDLIDQFRVYIKNV